MRSAGPWTLACACVGAVSARRLRWSEPPTSPDVGGVLTAPLLTSPTSEPPTSPDSPRRLGPRPTSGSRPTPRQVALDLVRQVAALSPPPPPHGSVSCGRAGTRPVSHDTARVPRRRRPCSSAACDARAPRLPATPVLAAPVAVVARRCVTRPRPAPWSTRRCPAAQQARQQPAGPLASCTPSVIPCPLSAIRYPLCVIGESGMGFSACACLQL